MPCFPIFLNFNFYSSKTIIFYSSYYISPIYIIFPKDKTMLDSLLNIFVNLHTRESKTSAANIPRLHIDVMTYDY